MFECRFLVPLGDSTEPAVAARTPATRQVCAASGTSDGTNTLHASELQQVAAWEHEAMTATRAPATRLTPDSRHNSIRVVSLSYTLTRG